jgi:geranylgeranyl pyrophosphate synthase
LAFQVADDIMDFQCELPGLASGRKEQQKATYPSVMGIVQAKKRLKDLLAQAFHQLNSYGDEAEPLRALAGFVGNQALREVGESLNEEMHP